MLELLPYNWEWHGISEVYLNLTRSVGCVHHFAWKANSSEVRLAAGSGRGQRGGRRAGYGHGLVAIRADETRRGGCRQQA